MRTNEDCDMLLMQAAVPNVTIVEKRVTWWRRLWVKQMWLARGGNLEVLVFAMKKGGYEIRVDGHWFFATSGFGLMRLLRAAYSFEKEQGRL